MGKLNWNPWLEIDGVKMDMNQAVDIARRVAGTAPGDAGGEPGYLWSPAADVVETPGAFVVTLEVPGVAREDVLVEVRGRSLWVRGERRRPPEGGLYRLLERPRGAFARRLALPPDIVRDAVTAVLADGILEITLPKKGPDKIRRRIPIS